MGRLFAFLMMSGLWFATVMAFAKIKDCDLSTGSLMDYEAAILKAAEKNDYKKMAAPLACILRMQSESDGMSRYLSSSFLRPLLGGSQTEGAPKDPRYKIVAQALEQLALKSKGDLQNSFVAEFSRGDWRFYTLFCEEGNVDYCSDFLPDETRVKGEPVLLAAASMLRLRKAYQVLSGPQRELIADRIKTLYREIPVEDRLRRKFIEEIHRELFQPPIPLSRVS